MSALLFPPTPNDGDTYEGYIFNAAKNVWQWVTTSIDAVNPGYGDILAYDPAGTKFTNTLDVNGVMVFDNSAARGSAIPTPSEGMVTYLKSDDQVTVFDGSAFKPVGGLVAVKDVLKTNVFSASVPSGNNVAVTGLSITHEVSDPANKLIISAFFGVAGNSGGNSQTQIAVAQDGTLIGIGDADGARTRVGAAQVDAGSTNFAVGSPSVTFVHTPGAGSKTYTVRAINARDGTRTVFINRSQADSDGEGSSRGVSALVIQEVAV